MQEAVGVTSSQNELLLRPTIPSGILKAATAVERARYAAESRTIIWG